MTRLVYTTALFVHPDKFCGDRRQVEIKLLAAAISAAKYSGRVQLPRSAAHHQAGHWTPVEYLVRSGGCIAAVWRLAWCGGAR